MASILLFFARIPVLVLTVVTAMGTLGSTALTAQTYIASQSSSQAQFEVAEEQIRQRIDASVAQQAALELAITNAKALLDSSSGKTLDDSAREALKTAISDAELALQTAKTNVALAQTNLKQRRNDLAGFVFPWVIAGMASELNSASIMISDELAQVMNKVAEKTKAVGDAQTAWQAEQDRIAAEATAAAARAAAERAAAARAAAARSAANAAGASGATTPSAPSAPATAQAAAPVSPAFNAGTFLAGLAPNARVIWYPNVCEIVLQRVVYLCGFTTTPAIAPGTNDVRIYLDSTFTDRYANRVGQSVLVHEAAHARQYAKYGAAMLKSETTVPSWVFNIAGDPYAPIEFMAECATIAKLGYGTGTYIGGASGNYATSCTAAQLAEGALLWQ